MLVYEGRKIQEADANQPVHQFGSGPLDPLGREHTEAFISSDALADRWSEMTQQLRQDGWSGPYGRDARA